MPPAPDAIVVTPATFNTINNWAAGTSETSPLAACGGRTRPPDHRLYLYRVMDAPATAG
jgi:hypothetical protein